MKDYATSLEYREQLEACGLGSLVSVVSYLYYSLTVVIYFESLIFPPSSSLFSTFSTMGAYGGGLGMSFVS